MRNRLELREGREASRLSGQGEPGEWHDGRYRSRGGKRKWRLTSRGELRDVFRHRECFRSAEGVAAVAKETIAVVAPFSRVQNMVAASGLGTIRATGIGTDVGVRGSLIALFSSIERPIAAEGRGEAAVIPATVGQRGIVEERFTLLSQELLHDVVLAFAVFEEALAAAAVEIARVSVIAFFHSCHDLIAAAWNNARFQLTTLTAAVAIALIPVVARFRRCQSMIAACTGAAAVSANTTRTLRIRRADGARRQRACSLQTELALIALAGAVA